MQHDHRRECPGIFRDSIDRVQTLVIGHGDQVPGTPVTLQVRGDRSTRLDAGQLFRQDPTNGQCKSRDGIDEALRELRTGRDDLVERVCVC